MTRDEIKVYIAGQYGDTMTLLESGKSDPFYKIDPSNQLSICRRLRDDAELKFDYLCNLGATDTGTQFEIVYSLASIEKSHRLDFKFAIPYDNAEIDSVQTVWPGANWFEREIWELYGMMIRNHGNLKRFLLPDDWNQGNPMRKNWTAPDFIKLPDTMV
ncbi:MAG: NADH-quinone oxidoreductase subunit C [candidate division Zixibacteria bacterium]|nr:NADH-quinone oxidoreductase subunit C [candidate division Zixibacteria bacterium]